MSLYIFVIDIIIFNITFTTNIFRKNIIFLSNALHVILVLFYPLNVLIMDYDLLFLIIYKFSYVYVLSK